MSMYVCMYVCMMYATVTAGSKTLRCGQHVVQDTDLNRSSLQDAQMPTSPINYIKNVTAH